ncbi:nitrilase-related carbon-nitrogen hydrolase [Leptospira idonii]|uniref:Carbon-nitrogen hydrolase family protein n=1 Tax=Leptospira idonii TaxID=1193500 RepID=A0A4R9M3U4_9LEPT|nr:nitrilase-related carbon-nitrogen hydrolase [Leptospira idonii]TGN20397.1 carbon-nitrogen hydrolase family protein [Leptospira idonii]
MKFFHCFPILLIFVSCNKTELSWEKLSKTQIEPSIEIQIEGKPQKGYLVGIEPYLSEESYSSEEAFYQTLKTYLDYAKKEEVLSTERSVVIFPEYIGTWLIAAGEDQSLFQKETVEDAMEVVVTKNLGRFLWSYLFSNNVSSEPLKETLFRMKAWQIAYTYQSVFSRLAKEYRIGIVAGSVILPEPKVIEGKITVTDGPLQNVSFYFRPDGEVEDKITRKSFPIDEEQTFLSSFPMEENPVITTPIGSLSILICADSWFPEAYSNAKSQSAEILAVPSLVAPADSWDKKWNGYNGYANPKDVSKSDLGNLTEWQAWKKYSLLGRGSKQNFKTGMNVFFRGKVWDITATGDAFLLSKGNSVSVKRKSKDHYGRIYAIAL